MNKTILRRLQSVKRIATAPLYSKDALKGWLTVAVVWVPLSFVINPGFKTLLAWFFPINLILLLPLLVYLCTSKYKGQMVPRAVFWAQIGFYAAWIGFGLFCLDNSGGSPMRIQSIFMTVFSTFFNYNTLHDITVHLTLISLQLIWVLALLNMSISGRLQNSNAKLSRMSLIIYVTVLFTCVLLAALR